MNSTKETTTTGSVVTNYDKLPSQTLVKQKPAEQTSASAGSAKESPVLTNEACPRPSGSQSK